MRPKLTCTGQVFKYDIFGRKATADTNLIETLQRLLKILACLTLFARVASKTGKPSKALRSQFREYKACRTAKVCQPE